MKLRNETHPSHAHAGERRPRTCERVRLQPCSTGCDRHPRARRRGVAGWDDEEALEDGTAPANGTIRVGGDATVRKLVYGWKDGR